jgi:hypothetical protein
MEGMLSRYSITSDICDVVGEPFFTDTITPFLLPSGES